MNCRGIAIVQGRVEKGGGLLKASHGLETEAFQVRRFRDRCNDGVIGSLGVLIDLPQGRLGVDRSVADHLVKCLSRDMMAAAKGGQDSVVV